MLLAGILVAGTFLLRLVGVGAVVDRLEAALPLPPHPQAGKWQRVRPDPVLVASAPWEQGAVFEPTVRYEDGQWKMWYSGGWQMCGLGYATSPDGVQWTKHPENPLLGGGRGGVDTMACRNTVVKEAGTYYLFFVDGLVSQGALHVATSLDGITFTPHPVPILRPGAWDTQIANTHVWVEDGRWWMLYEALDPQHIWQTGLASGPDPFTWSKHAANPLAALRVGRAPGMYGGPWVLKVDGLYHLWHHASRRGNLPTDIYHRQSADLLHWTGTSNRPVHGRVLPWETDQVADPSIVEANGRTYLYYSGMDNPRERGVIGVAVFDGPVTALVGRSR